MQRKNRADGTKYPVLYYKLTPGDFGFDLGYKFLVEQVDQDRHWFTEAMGPFGAEVFMHRHGMHAIPTKLMRETREVLDMN